MGSLYQEKLNLYQFLSFTFSKGFHGDQIGVVAGLIMAAQNFPALHYLEYKADP